MLLSQKQLSHHIESGKLVIYLFKYNYARYARSGSKPFLRGFQGSRFKVQGSLLFVTYTIIQGIISSEM